MKGRKGSKYHPCCGQRKRARMIDGRLVKQGHKCQDATDVRGVDWAKVREQSSKISLPKE